MAVNGRINLIAKKAEFLDPILLSSRNVFVALRIWSALQCVLSCLALFASIILKQNSGLVLSVMALLFIHLNGIVFVNFYLVSRARKPASVHLFPLPRARSA
jgi:hypothetical protein